MLPKLINLKILVRSFPDMENRLSQLKKKVAVKNANLPADSEAESGISLQGVSNADGQPANGETTTAAENSEFGKRASDQEEAPEFKDEAVVATAVDVEASDLAAVKYAHLQALTDFVKEELGDVLRLRSEIVNGTLKHIHFEDLWHLFEPGDVVYAAAEDNSERLFKVYFISGGQSLKRPPTIAEITEINNLRDKMRYWKPPVGSEDREEEEMIEEMLREEGSGIGTWTPFKVDCYSMMHDGERCGPVESCHRIWPYEGQREITSLRIYPLRFHPKKDELLETMMKRGHDYLFDEGYKSYDGKTCFIRRSDSQLEIQGDVYVDSSSFHQDLPHAKPRLGRVLRSKQNLAEVEEYSRNVQNSGLNPFSTPYKSRHDPDDVLTLSGHELDAKISDDFLTTNRLKLEPFIPMEGKIGSDELCLMPHYCFGYSFQLRKWCRCAVIGHTKSDQ
jgi:hypothetical protein